MEAKLETFFYFIISPNKYSLAFIQTSGVCTGACGSVVVEVLSYKLEGSRFET
jgi:hypothetical protein